jgi:hypothetical protein
MISAFSRLRSTLLTGSIFALAFAVPAHGQSGPQYRKTKALPPAARITVTVEKATNGKPLENAAVIFRASKEGKETGSLEIKSDPDGNAKIDIIEVGSHVTIQVIADGFATAATDFDVQTDEKNVLITMEKPRAQVSAYEDNHGKASQRPVGVQEPPPIAKPKPATPPAAAPAATGSSPQ